MHIVPKSRILQCVTTCVDVQPHQHKIVTTLQRKWSVSSASASTLSRGGASSSALLCSEPFLPHFCPTSPHTSHPDVLPRHPVPNCVLSPQNINWRQTLPQHPILASFITIQNHVGTQSALPVHNSQWRVWQSLDSQAFVFRSGGRSEQTTVGGYQGMFICCYNKKLLT